MKVTVCQLNNKPELLANDWELLKTHVHQEKSDLVLLPEMPFYEWFCARPESNSEQWQAAIEAHDVWMKRLHELKCPYVLGTRPVNEGNKRYNKAFVWSENDEIIEFHQKHNVPDQEEYWEASWYDIGTKDYTTVLCGETRIGFVICTEIWFMEYSRSYCNQGAHIIVNPRATKEVTRDKWLAAGRVSAMIGGAYNLSSNRSGTDTQNKNIRFGGQGWVIDPEDNVLGVTSDQEPFITREISLKFAQDAKKTYPRYVVD
jgi:N-carbamoylputrescine amidase